MFDFRSDTVTRPSVPMRQAMVQAEVGDDVFRDDPTVLRLEGRVAELLGKQAALYVPSGTMANQIALLWHCRPGDEAIIGRGTHCAYYESGAASAWAGLQFVEVGEDGLFKADDVHQALKPRTYYCPRSRLVVVENTHNRGGGRVFPQEDIAAIAQAARQADLHLHLDGARLWHAAIATGRTEAELAVPFETVSVCFSKGLGAPVGSALCGSHRAIEAALRFRRMFGGAMRQAGILAAAALYAIEHNRPRLSEDHQAAQQLAQTFRQLPEVSVGPVETNIVNLDLPIDGDVVVAAAERQGLKLACSGPRRLRLVTHMDVVGEGFDEAVKTLFQVVREAIDGR